MPLTVAQVQAQIVKQVGDIDPSTGDPVAGGGLLSAEVADYWAKYADKAYTSPRLQELYVERDLFDLVLAQVQDRYDFKDSDAVFSRRQRVDGLVKRREVVAEKITELEAGAAARRAPAVGTITTLTAVGPPFPLGLDAGDSRYTGSPYKRGPWPYP